METEQQLLNAIRDGEREAKRRLYERFAGRTMAIALRYVANQEDARDHGEGSLKAWVTSIVVHQALDYVKHHECLQMTDLLPDEPEEDEPDVRRVPPDVLWRLISQLPPGYRMVLNLYVFEQMSHKEIARLLGIAPGTSTSQYARAKKELAKRINNYLKNNKL